MCVTSIRSFPPHTSLCEGFLNLENHLRYTIGFLLSLHYIKDARHNVRAFSYFLCWKSHFATPCPLRSKALPPCLCFPRPINIEDQSRAIPHSGTSLSKNNTAHFTLCTFHTHILLDDSINANTLKSLLRSLI